MADFNRAVALFEELKTEFNKQNSNNEAIGKTLANLKV